MCVSRIGCGLDYIGQKKRKMEVFIINMTVLFYFPRGFSKACSKMYRYNRDGNHLKRVKGLNLTKEW